MLPWLKLDTGILDDEKIKVIRALPDGDTLFVLWIGILCLAMKKETESLYISEGVPYEDAHFATLFGIKIDTVKLGLSVFERLGMVTRYSNGGALHVTNLCERQALHKIDRRRMLTADRVRRHRQRKELEQLDVTRYSVTRSLPEEEVEEEVDNKNTSSENPFDTDFDTAWKAYPRKVNRKGAYKAYVAQRRKGIEAHELLTSVATYAKQCKGKEQQYILHGSTFFGPNDRWRDYVGSNGDTPEEFRPQARRVCTACGADYLASLDVCPKCGAEHD